MIEDRDFLARQVVAMIEEDGALAIGAELCPDPSHYIAGDFPSLDFPSLHEVESQERGCLGCGAAV